MVLEVRVAVQCDVLESHWRQNVRHNAEDLFEIPDAVRGRIIVGRQTLHERARVLVVVGP